MNKYRIIVMSPHVTANCNLRVFDDFVLGHVVYTEGGQITIKDKDHNLLFTGPSEYTIVIKQ